MRLGEIKNILYLVINESNQIEVEHEAIYGGQAYSVANYNETIEAINLIKDLSWNESDGIKLQGVIEKYMFLPNPVQLDQTDFNILNSYISSVNPKFALYFAILEATTDSQDEKIINIKLPPQIGTFTNLNKINKRLDDTLKLFNIDGEFEFVGFDKGSDWYEVLAVGVLSYDFIIACLNIAQECLKLRTEWFKSEEARISFEASKANQEELTQKQYEEKWQGIYLEEKIKDIIEKIGDTNGASAAETQVKLIKGTTKLIKELGKGTEFHLSLNPPEYASQKNGSLTIDYKKIREIRESEKEELEDSSPRKITEAIVNTEE